MIDDAEFNSLGDMVEASIMGARPVEEVQVELLWAILKELRSSRAITQQIAKQYNKKMEQLQPGAPWPRMMEE